MRISYSSKNLIFLMFISAFFLMPFFVIYAAEPTQNKQLALNEKLENALEEVVKIKDEIDTVESRKNALQKILDLTVLEIKDLNDQLNKLKINDVDGIEQRDEFLEQIKNFDEFLKGLGTRLATESFTMESIQELAKEFKTWREGIYLPTINNIIDFLLVYKGQLVLGIANSRFEKISNDIKKFKAAKLITTDDLDKLLAKAGSHLKTAADFNSQAMVLLFELLNPPEPIEGEGDLELNNGDEENETAPEEVVTVKSLVEKSLTEIKSAYGIFFEMSALVKKLLGL